MPKLAGRFLKVYIDNGAGAPQDVSADIDSVEIPDEYGSLDVTGFGEGAVNSIPGMPNLPIRMTGHFNPAATTGLFTVLKSIAGLYQSSTVTVQVGLNAAPVANNPEFEGEFWLASWPKSATPAGKIVINVNLEVFGSAAPAWGTVS